MRIVFLKVRALMISFLLGSLVGVGLSYQAESEIVDVSDSGTARRSDPLRVAGCRR